MQFIRASILMTSLFILITGLSFAAKTAEDCNDLLLNGSYPDILLLKDKSYSDYVNCATPDQSISQSLSPLDIFQLITNAISYLAYGLSIVAAVVAIIQIVTSAGDKTKFQNATDLLKNAALAFIITLCVYSFLTMTLKLLGFDIPKTGNGTPPSVPAPTSPIVNHQ